MSANKAAERSRPRRRSRAVSYTQRLSACKPTVLLTSVLFCLSVYDQNNSHRIMGGFHSSSEFTVCVRYFRKVLKRVLYTVIYKKRTT